MQTVKVSLLPFKRRTVSGGHMNDRVGVTKKRHDKSFWAVLSVVWILCALALELSTATRAVAQTPGTFSPTGSMTTARSFHTATLLLDGRVLIVGGGDRPVSAEIYDPVTATFTATGDMTTARRGHQATLLDDGRVLVTGGDLFTGLAPLKSTAEVFDPSSGTFARTGDMVNVQIGATATALNNGKVLIAGGITSVCCTATFSSGAPSPVANPELYDPSTGTFTLTGTFQSAGDGFYVVGGPNVSAATLLPDGRVLIAGEPTSEVYDPLTGTFSLTGAMTTPCFGGGRPQYIVGRTATVMMTGRVLMAGGEHEDCGRFADAELYDPARGLFTPTGQMARVRDNHTATLLPDGDVLIAGGESENGGTFSGTEASAEIYNPASGTFTAGGNMVARRAGHTATLLTSGRVLITGGYSYGGIGSYSCCFSSAELYAPRALVPSPTLLSLSRDGRGPGVIVRAGTEMVSSRTGAILGEVTSATNAAVDGEDVDIFTTGLGDRSSRIAPVVTIGGRRAEILFVRNVPGFPSVNQVTVRVPRGVAPGPAVVVRLTYLGRASNEVTVGVVCGECPH